MSALWDREPFHQGLLFHPRHLSRDTTIPSRFPCPYDHPHGGLIIHHFGNTASPWQQQWSALLTGLGCFPAFNHQPLLNPDERPVIQPYAIFPSLFMTTWLGSSRNCWRQA
ncbi:unnamed protein product [Merluccius merluccius]